MQLVSDDDRLTYRVQRTMPLSFH